MTVDEARSRTMRAVRSKNTKPEMTVRRLVHSLGFRFRLHRKDLPGTPDLVFPGRRQVIFVHGCFWHGHDCARGARQPKHNAGYWTTKIARNQERDHRAEQELSSAGWETCTLWECQLKDGEALQATIIDFLSRCSEPPSAAARKS